MSEELNNLEISNKFEQLTSIGHPDPVVCLHQWISFSENTKAQRDPQILSSSLQKAAEIALVLLENEPTDKNRTTFWLWQSRAMSMLEDSGDVYSY